MMPINPYKIFFVFSFPMLIAFLLLPILSNIAYKIGLLDRPNTRKIHTIPKPLTGGLGMIIAFMVSNYLFQPQINLVGFYAGIIILLIVGLRDDLREMRCKWKFAAQICASILMVYFSETILTSFGNLLGTGALHLGLASLPLTIFCTVGVINAVNMIDGLDGLAGGVSLIAFLSFAVLSYYDNQMGLMLLSLALSGAVVGFLIYNWHPSKLFMGDAGSLTLGFSLAYLSIAITQRAESSISPVTPLLILAVPIVDTLTVMFRRMLKGKSPFSADKTHLHHILLRFGINKRNAVLIILAMNTMFSITAISGIFFRIPDYKLFLIFTMYFISYVILSFYIRELFILKKRFVYKKIKSKRVGRVVREESIYRAKP